MAAISDVSGVSVEGDLQSERDNITLKLEDVAHDVEMARFTSLSDGILDPVVSGSGHYSLGRRMGRMVLFVHFRTETHFSVERMAFICKN